MDPQSACLEHGEWKTDTTESEPPAEIIAGESGMWRCKYRIVRYGEKDKDYAVLGYTVIKWVPASASTQLRQRSSPCGCWAVAGSKQLLCSYLVSQKNVLY